MERRKKLLQAMNNEHPMHPVPCRVVSVREEISGCYSLVVEPEADVSSAFAPGQFYMLYIFGHGEVPISVSGNSSDIKNLTFTIMNVGSVTKSLCSVNNGDVIGLRGPFGNPWPLERVKGKDVIVIAGGLGLAPLRPVIYHLITNATDCGEMTLLYGTRSSDTILFEDELVSWNDRDDMRAFVTVDSAGSDWNGHVGVVTELIEQAGLTPENTVAMICGPEIMMRFTAHALLDQGMKSSDIYVSMERNMKCALGHCGRCQYGPHFICKDGPVFSFNQVEHLFKIREV